MIAWDGDGDEVNRSPNQQQPNHLVRTAPNEVLRSGGRKHQVLDLPGANKVAKRKKASSREYEKCSSFAEYVFVDRLIAGREKSHELGSA
jgi:hypothetical protein